MHAVRLIVAYDGTDLVGWQRQPGYRSAQSALDEATTTLSGVPTLVRGASRTDAGVHAEGQVAAFDTPREIPPYGWLRGLNGKLPPDVVVKSAEPCAVGYDPRYDAREKTYRYLIHLDVTPDPLMRNRAWYLGPRRARPFRGARAEPEDWLDLDAMERAAELLVGEHDFHAFRSSNDGRESTVRTLYEVSLDRAHAGRPDLIAIQVRGNAFLQHMVRILAGTLVEVGRERLTLDALRELLGPAGNRQRGGETAPAHGLTLVRIELGR